MCVCMSLCVCMCVGMYVCICVALSRPRSVEAPCRGLGGAPGRSAAHRRHHECMHAWYVYVCMYVRTYVYMCVCMYVCMYVLAFGLSLASDRVP